ncbi:MAG: aspartate-semialdehyde dehydrogenase, partial [Fervidobacterium sp.]
MKVGIVGATGAVGRNMLEVLETTELKFSEVRLFASARSVGQILPFRGEDIIVELLTEDAMKSGFDYLLFSAGSDVSKHFAPIA